MPRTKKGASKPHAETAAPRASARRSKPKRGTNGSAEVQAAALGLDGEYQYEAADAASGNARNGATDGVLTLPDALDSAASTNIRDSLLACRGNPIVVDASQVRRAGVQSLQVLIAAARTWQSDGQNYRLANATTELLDAVALIGLQHADLMLEGSTP